ncbi:hypothetical protein ACFPRL_13510 [Pseudoclavibacter helvolus]
MAWHRCHLAEVAKRDSAALVGLLVQALRRGETRAAPSPASRHAFSGECPRPQIPRASRGTGAIRASGAPLAQRLPSAHGCERGHADTDRDLVLRWCDVHLRLTDDAVP